MPQTTYHAMHPELNRRLLDRFEDLQHTQRVPGAWLSWFFAEYRPYQHSQILPGVFGSTVSQLP